MADNSTGNFSNNEHWTFHPCPVDTPRTTGFKTAAYVLLMLISFVGNVLIIDIVRRNPLLRSTVDIFLANMCASDLLVPLFTIPYRIKEIFVGSEWFDGVFGTILCKLVPFAIDVSSAVSIFSMLAIAVERLRCVVCATKPMLFKVKARYRLIALIWVLSVITYSVYFYTFRLDPGPNSRVNCLPEWYPDYEYDHRAGQIHLTTIIILLTAVPLIVISVLYAAVIVSLYRQKIRIAAHLASKALRRRAKQNRKITWMLLTVVVVFSLAYVPFAVYSFLALYGGRGLYKLCNFDFISFFLFYIPTAINPVVYFVFNDKYRRGLRQLLCGTATCQSCQGPNHHPDNHACAAVQGGDFEAIEMVEIVHVQPL